MINTQYLMLKVREARTTYNKKVLAEVRWSKAGREVKFLSKN